MAFERYNSYQLPDIITKEYIEWRFEDCIIKLLRKDSVTGEISIEGIELLWFEEEQEWIEAPLSKEQCLEITEKRNLVIPFPKKDKELKDLFKKI